MAKCGYYTAGAKVRISEKIIEQPSEFKYLGNMISNCNMDSDLEYRIQHLT
jgi:hypothetical protein